MASSILGQALGVAIGASIAVAFDWRYAFITLGSVGVITALLVAMAIREPRRGGLDAAHLSEPTLAGARGSGFRSTVAVFFSSPALMLAALGSGATQIITYGAGNFSTLILMREKGMTLSQVALYYALVVGVCMSAGIFVSGRVIDVFTRRSRAAYAMVPAVALMAAIPFFLGFIWAPHWPLALAFMAGPTLLNYCYLSSSVALVQSEVRPDQRVLCGALLLLVMNLIGIGVGPTFVGWASDAFRAAHPQHSLQFAFLCLTPIYVLAIALFLALARVLKREDALSRRKT